MVLSARLISVRVGGVLALHLHVPTEILGVLCRASCTFHCLLLELKFVCDYQSVSAHMTTKRNAEPVLCMDVLRDGGRAGREVTPWRSDVRDNKVVLGPGVGEDGC